ncbi:tetratricopeptide repeat protein [Faecalibaculum rodentium]|uniref:tetratricopeptide repeat protein n=1 Tax=Faecalibaculum rodentium TaxID=1702221 RepID=UPI0023F1D64E|nr:hypothetical protein [Faecalibaculum rodentium]
MADYQSLNTQQFTSWIRSLETASCSGDLESTLVLRQCYLEGAPGLQADPGQALHYTWVAATQGDPRSMYHTAVVEYAQGKFESSARWMLRSWRTGIREASFGLARAYAYGRGLRQDLRLALEYLDDARECDAEPGQRESLRQWVVTKLVTRLLSENAGQEAVQILERENNAFASLWLADLDRDREQTWLLKANDQGSPEAMFRLAMKAAPGSAESFEYMRNAAKAGYRQAWLSLADCYSSFGIHPCPMQERRWKNSSAAARELPPFPAD